MSDQDQVVAAVCEAIIRENMRWEGMPADGPLPTFGAAKVYVSDVERYVRVGIEAYRLHTAAQLTLGTK